MRGHRILILSWLACGGENNATQQGNTVTPPAPICDVIGAAAPLQLEKGRALNSAGDESWLGSPAIADLDGDSVQELVIARDESVVIWHPDGKVVKRLPTQGRVWSSPAIGDVVPSLPGLEIVAAARDAIYLWDAQGELAPGFPFSWQDEMRSVALGDIDGDGMLEIVASTTSELAGGGFEDLIIAVEGNGAVVDGFPPNTSGSSGCDENCFITGGYDQNIALGDVNGDGRDDIVATQDNAYVSLHEGNGRAFDAAKIFKNRTKFPGIRFMLNYAEAKQGFAENETTASQAHFTNTAPAIADVDGDGTSEVIILASVQNAAQDDRERGVALFAVHSDGTRPSAWVKPFHAPDFLAGLWDFEGENVVAATNQVSVADIDPDLPGPEFVFAGFDGHIHAVSSMAKPIWNYSYTSSDRILTGGTVIADLNSDGIPEIVFATYSPDNEKSRLVVLDAGGNEVFTEPLPKRGAMAVPSIADIDGDGKLEVVVSLKDSKPEALVFHAVSSSAQCVLWGTGRGNLLRNGSVPAK